jgi:hypothetical protein
MMARTDQGHLPPVDFQQHPGEHRPGFVAGGGEGDLRNHLAQLLHVQRDSRLLIDRR